MLNKKLLIQNALVVNEGKSFKGSVLIENDIIIDIFDSDEKNFYSIDNIDIIDGSNKVLIPGIIDDQVHFREPGLSYKADIYTESKAAIAGGITSYMEMPNTNPQTTSQTELEKKYKLASEKSLANYSFYLGATNTNIDELLKTNLNNVCGIKVFMGSSTGNMLVDDINTLTDIFSKSKALIAVHCEDESIIKSNTIKYKQIYGEDVPIEMHPKIRSEEACYSSSKFAVELAKKYNTRLHILHLSTSKELELFSNKLPVEEKRITAEVCVHHLWFDENDYKKHKTKIKWNPAVKSSNDRKKLFEALKNNTLDVIATDHAPHTEDEKNNTYFKAPSGGPLVQHSLVAMLEFYHKGEISLEQIVEKMSHAPAKMFSIKNRGFIRKNYKADLVLLDLDSKWEVNKKNILYKCNWSPFEAYLFKSKVLYTIVNGNIVYNKGVFFEQNKGERLIFDRD